MTTQPGAGSKGEGPRIGPVGLLSGGFGDALAQAFEFAVIPILFAVGGVGLDAWLGTRPWLTVVLIVIGLTGVVARTVYVYKAKVEEEEEGKPWTRRARR